MARLLLDRGADIERQDSHGPTPLFFASDDRMVHPLLDAGADPLHRASDNDLSPLAAYLRGPVVWRAGEPEPAPSPAAFKRLLEAAQKGSPHWSMTLNHKMGHWTQTKETLLQMAAGKGAPYTRLLLDMGADPNEQAIPPEGPPEFLLAGLSPLQEAARSNAPDALEISKLLVEYGARVDDIDSYDGWTGGNSALTEAIWHKKHDLVEWLVTEADADPNPNPGGWSAPGRPEALVSDLLRHTSRGCPNGRAAYQARLRRPSSRHRISDGSPIGSACRP